VSAKESGLGCKIHWVDAGSNSERSVDASRAFLEMLDGLTGGDAWENLSNGEL
jgi:hypothetical protein